MPTQLSPGEEQRNGGLAQPAQRERMLSDALSCTMISFTFSTGTGVSCLPISPFSTFGGIPLEGAVGKNFFDLKYPDDVAARLQRQVQEVFETRKRIVDETRGRVTADQRR